MHSKKFTVRFASAISAAVIGFTSTVISFFDCPVYAAYGGAAWGEFFGFYSLLEGFGFGQDNTEFINSVDNWIDSLQPEEKPREDYDGEWMTDAQYWQQCQYDKFTGWLDNLVDSWSESYDAVGDVGSGGVSVGGNVFRAVVGHDDIIAITDVASSNGVDTVFDCDNPLYSTKPVTYRWEFDRSSLDLFFCNYVVDGQTYSLFFSSHDNFNALLYVHYFNTSFSGYSSFSFSPLPYNGLYYCTLPFSCPFISSSIPPVDLNLTNPGRAAWDVLDALCPGGAVDFQIGGLSSDFVGPVYTYPAAQELARQNKTSTGIRLDVNTADGVPDVKAALDGAGVSTVDELAASVAAGDVAMQDVFADAKVTPYVVADTASGVVVTDLGVAADAAGVKPVALTNELTVPADLTTAATYAIQGKTWDPDMAKYRLPLFQYFPFCLPWDIYQVLSSFAADPVAPQIEIPIGKFFANKKSFDGSAVANYTATLDLGDEKFSKWFSALRLLESAGIIIGLVLISVHLIHGGR